MRRKGQRQNGQSLVESALVLIAFVTLVIAAFDLGMVLFIQQSFVERARNAVRYAAAREFDPETVRNMILYNQPQAPPGGGGGFLGLTPSMVAVSREGNGTTEDRLLVTISGYPYRFFLPWIAGTFYGHPIRVWIPVEGY